MVRANERREKVGIVYANAARRVMNRAAAIHNTRDGVHAGEISF